jgi:hypothetical protein
MGSQQRTAFAGMDAGRPQKGWRIWRAIAVVGNAARNLAGRGR